MLQSQKIILANFGGVLLALVLFDLVIYNMLPPGYSRAFEHYRKTPEPRTLGRSNYPQHYFVKHPTRGFDIGLNRQGNHWFGGVDYPIWSNSLGCFDREHEQTKDYVYFAGDSFTWGYTPFEQKFGTLVEQQSGMNIFKCGVTHTGQRHQFGKFRDVIEQHGKAPQAVFVFYYANDIANDYAHPHSEALRGWQIDRVRLDADYQLVRLTDSELNQKMDDVLARWKRKRKLWWQSAAKPLLRYSLSANIFNTITEKTKESISSVQGQIGSAPQTAQESRSLYELPVNLESKYWVRDNPYSQANKQALLDFKHFSEQQGIQYVVVLIPEKRAATNSRWYRELHEFLNENEIETLDLATKFGARNLAAEDIYWSDNGHFNPTGNKVLADILLEHYPNSFRPH